MADKTCSPQIASGPLADLGYAEEVCYGTIPVNPELKTCRRRSTTLALTKETYDSEEIRSDRMVSDSRHGIRSSGGDVVTEISPGAHAPLYEALLGGTWVAPTAIAITASSVTLVAGSTDTILRIDGIDVAAMYTADYLRGDVIAFAGTGSPAMDGGLFQLIAENDGGSTIDVIPMNRGFDTSVLPIAMAAGTFTGQPRVDMANIYRSFVFERAFTDIGSFIQYTGQRVNSAAIDLPPTGIATSTFTLMGKDALPISSASIDGVTEVILDDTVLTSLTFDAVAGTITAAAGDFAAAGFVPGDRVTFAGDGITDPQNRNPRTIVGVTPTVLTVAEAIQTGGPYTAPFTVTKVGLPDYTAAPDDSVMVAVSGVLVYEGQIVGTVTAMSISIDNQMAGSNVVGQNVMPVNLWGNQCIVGGSMTVLFDRGGIGEQMYNGFDNEDDDLSIYMTLTDPTGTEAVSFVMPRCKINTGTIGDAVAEGLPVACDYRALKPSAANVRDGDSQVIITDTSVTGSVAPFSVFAAGSGGGGAPAAPAFAQKSSAPKGGSGLKSSKKDDAPQAIAAE